MREPAEYYVTSSLKSSVIFQNFVDCVLHYNDSAGAGKGQSSQGIAFAELLLSSLIYLGIWVSKRGEGRISKTHTSYLVAGY